MTLHVSFAQVWAAWVDPHNKPVRACVAAPMAHPDILVEVMVTAAKLKRSKHIHRLSSPLYFPAAWRGDELKAARLLYCAVQYGRIARAPAKVNPSPCAASG